jgi:HrpA-like RNA helicase
MYMLLLQRKSSSRSAQRIDRMTALARVSAPPLHHRRRCAAFDFLEPPDEDQLVEALQLLHCLGAIDQDGNVTQLGMQVHLFFKVNSRNIRLGTAVVL